MRPEHILKLAIALAACESFCLTGQVSLLAQRVRKNAHQRAQSLGNQSIEETRCQMKQQ